MEHPILFISVILEALGLPVPHGPVGHTFLEQICAPYMTYTWLVMALLILVAALIAGGVPTTELLDDEERAVWRRLAVFEGGFTADAAAAVVGASAMAPADVREVLDGLVDRRVDLCGGRVITHLQRDVTSMCDFIKSHFEIDWETSSISSNQPDTPSL